MFEGLTGYDTIVADPPWPVKKILRRDRPNQGTSLSYRTMKLDDIRSLPVAGIAAESALLFLWTTHSFLEPAFGVMHAWGFRYQRCLTWDKMNGMCLYGFHYRTEFCLVGYRGQIKIFPSRPAIPTVFQGRSPRHSAKPDEFYALIEPIGNKRIDLFARKPRSGWDVWGDEVDTILL